MGYKPQGPAELGLANGNPPFKIPTATQRAEELRDDRKKIAELLRHSQKYYEKWYNKRRTPQSFNVKDWVLVSTDHIKQRRPCRKFADKWLGPWQITEVVGEHGLAYKLAVPKPLRIHPVFPISALEIWNKREDGDPEPKETTTIDLANEYKVKVILDY